MKILKCWYCGKDIEVNSQAHVILCFPKNTPEEWKSFFHFPDCFAEFVKVAALPEEATREESNV